MLGVKLGSVLKSCEGKSPSSEATASLRAQSSQSRSLNCPAVTRVGLSKVLLGPEEPRSMSLSSQRAGPRGWSPPITRDSGRPWTY